MLLNSSQRKLSLKSKLSILVTTAVILVVVVLGLYFDSFLKRSFLETTRIHMHHGYERLSYNLKNIERELNEGSSFARSDESTIASIELINNYQDKSNYNIYLIDEEKKSIASQLLNRVKLSFNENISLYDINKELVAFVAKENNTFRPGYVSFKHGQAKVFSRNENQREYLSANEQSLENISSNFEDHYSSSELEKNSLISYHRINDRVDIKYQQSIYDTSSNKVVGHIEMSRSLDAEYFKRLSDELDLDVSYSFDEDLNQYSGVLKDSPNAQQLNILQSDYNYTAVLSQVIHDGTVYYLVNMNKVVLNSLLSKSRAQLFIFLVFVTACIMLLMRFVIGRGLDRPLSELMEQIHKIERQDYSVSKPISTGDELEAVSKNINQLAQAVQERELSLGESRNELEYLSNHDVLTDLPNRRIFSQNLQHAIDLASRNNGRLAVFFLDLDQFKRVNDTLGHDVGDELLIHVSRRLSKHVRASDTLARIGGDEFNVLVENAPSKSDLSLLVEKYMSLFDKPFHCCGHDLNVTVSIGVSLFPDDGLDSVALIKHADLAMYNSKDHGRNNYTFFSKELSLHAQERADLINGLEAAIDSSDQFELHYQPKLLAGSHELVSMEALIRWRSPEFGYVLPDEFIKLAEETGLIIPIGKWVLQQACRDFVRLQEEGIDLQHVSINISNIQLYKSDMIKLVEDAIDQSGIKHDQIELEITESYIATDVEKAIETLKILHDMKIGLAIDDFGTGYSSMNYLQKLPVTRLKIDKSFVDEIPQSKESATIIRAIIGLAKSFDLAITAEGVETKSQLTFLENEQCDEIQGYYFSKPLSLDEFRAYYYSKQEVLQYS